MKGNIIFIYLKKDIEESKYVIKEIGSNNN